MRDRGEHGVMRRFVLLEHWDVAHVSTVALAGPNPYAMLFSAAGDHGVTQSLSTGHGVCPKLASSIVGPHAASQVGERADERGYPLSDKPQVLPA